MPGILRLIGLAFGFFILLVILTATVTFIKHAWFGGSSGGNHVRVVEVDGVIYNSRTLLKNLKEHLENKSTKAIVLRINSPGGLVAPSQEIFEAFKNADAKVPVIVSMSTVAASGGYYIALAGRKIYANPGTLTGSIGVIMEFGNLQKLYQWAKMERYSITSGKFKDAGTPLRPMTPEEKSLFQAMVNDTYAQFRGAVKERRKLSDEELNRWADGRVVTGQQALGAKLVDAIGGIEDAVKEAKAVAKLPEDATVKYPEKPGGMLKRLLMGDPDEPESRLWDALTKAAAALPENLDYPGWRVLWLSPVH